MNICKRGHAMTPENTYNRKRYGKIKVECIKCKALSDRKRSKSMTGKRWSLRDTNDKPSRKQAFEHYNPDGLALLCGAVLRYKSGSNSYTAWIQQFTNSRYSGRSVK